MHFIPMRDGTDQDLRANRPSLHAQILIAADEAANIAHLVEVLGEERFDQIQCLIDPGRELDWRRDIGPDAVILDVDTSRLDGQWILENLRGMQCDEVVPILIADEPIEPTIQLQVLDAGPTDVTTKPLDGADLACKLHNFGRLKPMYRALFDAKLSAKRQVCTRTARLNDALDLPKAEADKLDILLEQVEAPEVVESSLRMLSGLAAEAGVGLRFDFPNDFPPLRTDKQRLRQALINIVTNALEITPAGGSFTVKGRYESDGGAAVLMVSDRGRGIAKKDVLAALKFCDQVRSEQTGKALRTGLDLPLARRLVEAAGARFVFAGSAGEGTVAILQFPPQRVAPEAF